jgi:hypothetical protein
MYFGFVDANIFIRIMSQGKPGCESNLFRDLKVLCENGVLALLVPETVLLELQKEFNQLPRAIKEHFGSLNKAISTTSVWSEIADVKQMLEDQLKDMREQKINAWKELYSEIDAFLNSDSVIKLPFTPEIWCRAKRRLIAGKMPDCCHYKDQDASIVEALVDFFTGNQYPNPVLFFCSENHRDFGIEIPNEDRRERIFALHPLLAGDLPPAYFFTNLQTMLHFARGYESLPAPLTDVQLKEAQKRLDEFNDSGMMNDDNLGEYGHVLKKFEQLRNERLAKCFTEEIIPDIPAEIIERRDMALGRELRTYLTSAVIVNHGTKRAKANSASGWSMFQRT